jgi:hypothetical protein
MSAIERGPVATAEATGAEAPVAERKGPPVRKPDPRRRFRVSAPRRVAWVAKRAGAVRSAD